MTDQNLTPEELEILKDDSPWYPTAYHRGARSAEAALRLGIITESDIVAEEPFNYLKGYDPSQEPRWPKGDPMTETALDMGFIKETDIDKEAGTE